MNLIYKDKFERNRWYIYKYNSLFSHNLYRIDDSNNCINVECGSDISYGVIRYNYPVYPDELHEEALFFDVTDSINNIVKKVIENRKFIETTLTYDSIDFNRWYIFNSKLVIKVDNKNTYLYLYNDDSEYSSNYSIIPVHYELQELFIEFFNNFVN